jgi:hypothetical protein
METRRRGDVLGSYGGGLVGGGGRFVLRELVPVGAGRPEVPKTGERQVVGGWMGHLGSASAGWGVRG